MRRTLFILLALAFFLPGMTSAQALGGLGNTTDSFSISVTPQYPAPGSTAVLSFLSSALDLTNATMTVSVGSKQIYQGSIHPIPVTVGKAGSATTITVDITSAGTSYSQSLTLQPQDISLIAEPLASAPVLYPGKPSVPMEGNTRVVAIANLTDAAGKTIDPATLSYSWNVDNTQIANSSGIGKSAIIVASPLQYRLRTVSVSVQTQTGNLSGKASLSLDPKNAVVRLYENDPLLGIRFDHALTSAYTISGTEASLYAAPFSLPLIGGTPLIQWFLNGAAAQTGSLITLRPSGKGKGTAALSLTATGGTSVAATANLPLIFGATKSNFFGL